MILFKKRIALYVITYSSAIYLIVTSLKAFCYLQIDIETEIRELISYDEYLRPTTETISSYATQHSRKRVRAFPVDSFPSLKSFLSASNFGHTSNRQF